MRCKDPARNPVSAMANITGYLLHSNGPKVRLSSLADWHTEASQIYVKGLDYDDRLMGLAFLDVMLYVTCIKVFKNLILLSDMVKSVWFISLQVRPIHLQLKPRLIVTQEDPYKFTIISRDLQPLALLTADFLVHEGQLTFVTNDRPGEMRMIDFDPAG